METETLHTTRYILVIVVILVVILILIIGDNLAMHARAVKTHLVDLAASYILSSTSLSSPSLSSSTSPSIYIVNLIDKQGTQGKLGRLLFAAMQMVQRGGVLAFSQNSNTTTANTITTSSSSSSITTSSNSVLDAVSSLGTDIHYHYYYNTNTNPYDDYTGGDGIPTRVNRITNILNRTGITSEGTNPYYNHTHHQHYHHHNHHHHTQTTCGP